MKIIKMTKEYAIEMAQWQYDSPYDLYNMSGNYEDFMVDYFAVVAADLIGFSCFGVEAQVPPGDYNDYAIDIGLGMNPSLCGRGEGEEFLKCIIEYAQINYKRPLRLTVAGFNTRAIRLYKKVGFTETSRFYKSDREFIIMIL